jgi:uncharacterized protein YgbK (DUF1537 family)
MGLTLGCIADDFTGATDLGSVLVRGGLRTVQTIGIPEPGVLDGGLLDGGDLDAVVVALKSRTIPAADAVAQSLAALEALRALGAEQVYFKYCSTFDSTPAGNIGPVAEALMSALGAGGTIHCPAFPANGRTVYQGHLFVGRQLLSESPMRDHPLTPMRDPNIVRVLAAQSRLPVGLVAHDAVRGGPTAARAAIDGLGVPHAIVDCVSDGDLDALGAACAGMPLVCGGSALGQGIAARLGREGRLAGSGAAALPPAEGAAAVLAGSCSAATRRQVAEFGRDHLAVALDPLAPGEPDALAAAAFEGIRGSLGARPVLVYSTAEPERVAEVQRRLGVEAAGARVEATLAALARLLVGAGVRRLVVAGGETSGAVVQALGVRALRIGPQIDTGVPWTHATGGVAPLALALKSGNFGGEDFFRRAFALLEAGAR